MTSERPPSDVLFRRRGLFVCGRAHVELTTTFHDQQNRRHCECAVHVSQLKSWPSMESHIYSPRYLRRIIKNKVSDSLCKLETGRASNATAEPKSSSQIAQLPSKKRRTSVGDTTEVKSSLIMALAEVGGTDCKSATRFMMKKLLSYQVAAKYSWIGQKGKDKFSEFVFPDIILRALKVNRATKPYANEKDVKDYIMDFLKHSKEKLTTRKNSGLPQTQRENSEVTGEEDG